jgi:hypothetical protein
MSQLFLRGREKKKEASALTPIAKQLKNYLQENGADMMLGGLLVAAAALLAGGVDDAVATRERRRQQGATSVTMAQAGRHCWAGSTAGPSPTTSRQLVPTGNGQPVHRAESAGGELGHEARNRWALMHCTKPGAAQNSGKTINYVSR